MDKLYALPIDGAAKRAIADTLQAAANPDHGKPAVIVRSLPKERQALIVKTARRMKSITDDVMDRGKARLFGLSDEEWDKLVSDE